MPTCSACQKDLPRSCFAQAQMKKNQGRRCKQCTGSSSVESGTEAAAVDVTEDAASLSWSRMTNKEAQAASVAAVAEIARKRDPQFAEAFIRPALKTAPVFFSSIEDAEAAGFPRTVRSACLTRERG